MLDGCSNLRVVRKPRLEMKINKANISLNVSQMSDGGKMNIRFVGVFGVTATLANPNKENPLLGEGIVLIDEVELHMHPSWQRKVLSALRDTFPNIQFIITTHSPIVLSEADENYNLFFIDNSEGKFSIQKNKQLNGYDANAVLEQFMDTSSINEKIKSFIDSIYDDINSRLFEQAEVKINALAEITSENHPDVITARMELKRRRYI